MMTLSEASAALNAAFNAKQIHANFALVPVQDGRFDVVIRIGTQDTQRAVKLAEQILGAQFNSWRMSRP